LNAMGPMIFPHLSGKFWSVRDVDPDGIDLIQKNRIKGVEFDQSGRSGWGVQAKVIKMAKN